MIDERQEELAALAAFDLLEGGEKAQFDGEMARNPELRRRVEELRAAASALAYAAPQIEPPAALKERILASADSRRQAHAPTAVSASKIVPFPVIIAWAAAACFAVGLAVTAQLYFGARTRNAMMADNQRAMELQLNLAQTRLESQQLLSKQELAVLQHDRDQALALAKQETAKYQAALAASNQKGSLLTKELAAVREQMHREGDLAQMKIATLTSLLGNSPAAQAVAVWNPATQQGVVSVASLPVAGSDQDYELWVIPTGDKAAPIPAGLVRVDSDGSGRAVFKAGRPVAQIAKFAISLEAKGGAPAPAGKIVLLSK